MRLAPKSLAGQLTALLHRLERHLPGGNLTHWENAHFTVH